MSTYVADWSSDDEVRASYRLPSGYYEWKTINGAKPPFYFSATDGRVLSIAGLWDE
jgi:hypothetical protein